MIFASTLRLGNTAVGYRLDSHKYCAETPVICSGMLIYDLIRVNAAGLRFQDSQRMHAVLPIPFTVRLFLPSIHVFDSLRFLG